MDQQSNNIYSITLYLLNENPSNFQQIFLTKGAFVCMQNLWLIYFLIRLPWLLKFQNIDKFWKYDIKKCSAEEKLNSSAHIQHFFQKGIMIWIFKNNILVIELPLKLSQEHICCFFFFQIVMDNIINSM